MTRARALVCVLLLAAPAAAAAGDALPGQGAEGPNPAAPPETGQFSFLVGTWNCTTQRLQSDGTYRDGARATWTGCYILDGWAIQDVWVSSQPDGSRFYGTNIRSFDPERKKWDNRWAGRRVAALELLRGGAGGRYDGHDRRRGNRRPR